MKFSFKIIVLVAAYVQAQDILQELKSHPNWNLIDHGVKCGKSKPSSRIIGGKDASLGQFPWIAQLGTAQTTFTAPMFICGGSIINDRYVLTAAHCLRQNDRPIPLDVVRLGEYDTSTKEDCDVNKVCAPPVQDIKIEESVCHSDFNEKNYRNDICLLRLAAPIQFNNFVRPICLPSYDLFKKNNFEGLKMEVAGWGKSDIVSNQFASVLSTLKIPVLSQSVCQSDKVYKTKLGPMGSSQMCAGGVVGKDSCGGDSGGPLMYAFDYGGRPRYFIIGLVSIGNEICGSKTPAIYTRVPDYMLWILDNIRE